MTAHGVIAPGLAAALAGTATMLAIGPSPQGRLAVLGGTGSSLGVGGRQGGGLSTPFRGTRAVLLGSISITALLLLAGPTMTVGVIVAVAVGGGVARRARRHRRARVIQLAVYEMCRAIAAELRAGSTPSSAFRAAAEVTAQPLFAVLGPVARDVANHDPAELADALAAAAATGPPYRGLRTLAACWRVVVAAGSMMAPAVDRVADALHDEVDLDRELATSLASTRATVRLLAMLPVVGLGLGMAIGAHPLAFLLESPAGWACLLVAVTLDAAGVWWVRAIARGAMRLSRAG